MLAKLTRSDGTPDENSDDLLGFHFKTHSSGRIMRRAYRRPSLYACKTHSFGRHSRRELGRPSRVPLHTYLVQTTYETSVQTTVSVCLQNSLVRTILQTSIRTTFSGSTSHVPRSDELLDEPTDDRLCMLAKLTRSDDTPDENSDDLLGFHFTRTSSGRIMRRAYRRPSLYACKTHSFGREIGRHCRRAYR
jgi:hypothetical protein